MIPVYNSEKYLPGCLNNIVKQTYKNLEIIIVNNGSKGNVAEIYKFYSEKYSEFLWKFVDFQYNQGIFLARASGWKIATGDYYTTVDSDDSISIDYYYQLQKTAITSSADIVFSDFVHDFKENCCMTQPMNPFSQIDICWENSEALRKYLEFSGRSFNLHAPWNKLIHRSVYEQAQKYIDRINKHIVLSEDVLFNTLFFAFSKKTVNTHTIYYHAVYSNASSSNIAANEEKIRKGFEDQYTVFQIIRDFLDSIGKSKYETYVRKFEINMLSVMFANLKCGDLSLRKEIKIEKQALKKFNLLEAVYAGEKNLLIDSCMVMFNDDKEKILRMLSEKQEKVICFFYDQLLEWPCLDENDLVEILENEFNNKFWYKNYIHFSKYRKLAEDKIRLSDTDSDISLESIYDELMDMGIITYDEKEWLLQKEIEIKCCLCRKRKIGFEICDFAYRMNKKIVCINTSIYSNEMLNKCLYENGYEDFSIQVLAFNSNISLQKEEFISKVAERNSTLKKDILCIPYNKDNCEPYKNKEDDVKDQITETSIYIPKNVKLFFYDTAYLHAENMLSLYKNLETNYLGDKCMLGLILNDILKNPFISFYSMSLFNASPAILGYMGVGPYAFKVAMWLINESNRCNCDTIHFISQDSLFLKQVYDILAKYSSKKCAKSNELIIEKEAYLPSMLVSSRDIYTIPEKIRIQTYTPELFLKGMKSIISPLVYDKRDELLNQYDISKDTVFSSYNIWIKFAKVFKNIFYSKEMHERFILDFREKIKKQVGDNDCIFDMGISGSLYFSIEHALETKIPLFSLFKLDVQDLEVLQAGGYENIVFHDHEDFEYDEKMLFSLFLCPSNCEERYINYVSSFEQFEKQSKFLIDVIQKKAIHFVYEYIMIFRKEWERLNYGPIQRIFIDFIYDSLDFDRNITKNLCFKDGITGTICQPVNTVWCDMINRYKNFDVPENQLLLQISASKKWKKAIFLALYDRRQLKSKVKMRYENNFVLFYFMKIGYKFLRKIYYMVK